MPYSLGYLQKNVCFKNQTKTFAFLKNVFNLIGSESNSFYLFIMDRENVTVPYLPSKLASRKSAK